MSEMKWNRKKFLILIILILFIVVGIVIIGIEIRKLDENRTLQKDEKLSGIFSDMHKFYDLCFTGLGCELEDKEIVTQWIEGEWEIGNFKYMTDTLPITAYGKNDANLKDEIIRGALADQASFHKSLDDSNHTFEISNSTLKYNNKFYSLGEFYFSETGYIYGGIGGVSVDSYGNDVNLDKPILVFSISSPELELDIRFIIDEKHKTYISFSPKNDSFNYIYTVSRV